MFGAALKSLKDAPPMHSQLRLEPPDDTSWAAVEARKACWSDLGTGAVFGVMHKEQPQICLRVKGSACSRKEVSANFPALLRPVVAELLQTKPTPKTLTPKP